jgi:hypothetical protein
LPQLRSASIAGRAGEISVLRKLDEQGSSRHTFENTHIQVLLPRMDELCVGMPEIKIWEKIS